MIDEINLCKKWLRFFARPAKHWASRPCEEYARRVSIWAGVPIRPDAFLKAASQLNYEMRSRRSGEHLIKAEIS